jgi:hypothetical protein
MRPSAPGVTKGQRVRRALRTSIVRWYARMLQNYSGARHCCSSLLAIYHIPPSARASPGAITFNDERTNDSCLRCVFGRALVNHRPYAVPRTVRGIVAKRYEEIHTSAASASSRQSSRLSGVNIRQRPAGEPVGCCRLRGHHLVESLLGQQSAPQLPERGGCRLPLP